MRQEMERRNISIASISESTKILGALLEGLENDDVSRWPTGFYRRAFMRAYAKSIGVDADAALKEFLEQLQRPSGLSDDEAIARALKLIEGAVQSRRTEVQVYRFPNTLCTDNGRAINQIEPGWQSTLTGVPKEVYELWERQFKDRGYKLRVEIIDYPNGMPGDVAMTLTWAES